MNKEFTPEDGFAIISEMIQNAKVKFEENGFMFMLWGVVVGLASLAQFMLLEYGYYKINYYPYFIIPIVVVLGALYNAKRKTRRNNVIGKLVSFVWLVLSVNMIGLGAFLGNRLGPNLIPVLLILMSLGIIVSGLALKSRLLIISGIIINISGFICFLFAWLYQPLLMSIVSFVAVFIPGLILMIKKNNYAKKT